jgi:hypothetical protein
VNGKKPAMPVYDRERDGNPFEWIVRMAPVVRRERLDGHLADVQTRRLMDRLANRPVKP